MREWGNAGTGEWVKGKGEGGKNRNRLTSCLLPFPFTLDPFPLPLFPCSPVSLFSLYPLPFTLYPFLHASFRRTRVQGYASRRGDHRARIQVCRSTPSGTTVCSSQPTSGRSAASS